MSSEPEKPVLSSSKTSPSGSKRIKDLTLEDFKRQMKEAVDEFKQSPVHPALIKKPPPEVVITSVAEVPDGFHRLESGSPAPGLGGRPGYPGQY